VSAASSGVKVSHLGGFERGEGRDDNEQIKNGLHMSDTEFRRCNN